MSIDTNGRVVGWANDTTGDAFGVSAKQYKVLHVRLEGRTGKVTKNLYDNSRCYGIYTYTNSNIILKAGNIIAKSANNTALKAFLPTTPFWFRTMETAEFADGLTEAFKPDQAAYVEMVTNGIVLQYAPNGATGSMKDNYIFHNGTVHFEVLKSAFAKAGHKFLGFKRSDNGEIVSPGNVIKFLTDKSLSTLKLTAQWEKYKITNGADSTWHQGSDKILTFKSDADFENLKEVQIDGKTLDKNHYTAEKGSTVVNLKTDYLNTLDLGEHKLSLLYNDGSQFDAKFKILAEKKGNVPQTGDTSNLLPLLALSVGSSCMIAAVMLTLKKRKENN